MGALSGWPMGLAGAVGLDLGRQPTLGLRVIALWALGQCVRPLGMDSGAAEHAPGLRARIGRLRRRSRLERIHFARRRLFDRLVPAGPTRGLRAVLSGQSQLL